MKRSSHPPPERAVRVGFTDDVCVGFADDTCVDFTDDACAGYDGFTVGVDALEAADFKVDAGELDEGFKVDPTLTGEEERAREGREAAAVGEEGRTSDGDTGRREARGDEGRPASEAED